MFPVSKEKLAQEELETTIAIKHQLKIGIIKARKMEPLLVLNDGQQLKDMGIRITPIIVSKVKGHELYSPCQCGNSETLKDCVDCLRRLKLIA